MVIGFLIALIILPIFWVLAVLHPVSNLLDRVEGFRFRFLLIYVTVSTVTALIFIAAATSVVSLTVMLALSSQGW